MSFYATLDVNWGKKMYTINHGCGLVVSALFFIFKRSSSRSGEVKTSVVFSVNFSTSILKQKKRSELVLI